MANWNTLKTAVADIINANGNQAITGQLLQNVLNNIITNVGENATFAGIATPTTNPGAPDGPVFYLATQEGTYSNFNGIVISSGEAVILEWNGSWLKKTSGFSTKEYVDKKNESTKKYVDESLSKINDIIGDFGSALLEKLVVSRVLENYRLSMGSEKPSWDQREGVNVIVFKNKPGIPLLIKGVCDTSTLQVIALDSTTYGFNGVELQRGSGEFIYYGTAPEEYSYIAINIDSETEYYAYSIEEKEKITSSNLITKGVSDVISINLYNKNAEGVKKGFYLGGNGSELENSSYAISDYIPFTKDMGNLIMSRNGKVLAEGGGFLWTYDRNKKPISGNINTNLGGILAWEEGVSYARFSINAYNVGDIQIQIGTEATEYVPFEKAMLNQNAVQNYSITPQKTSFFKTNFFDKDNEENIYGYYLSGSGNLLANENYMVTHYIPFTKDMVNLIASANGTSMAVAGGFVCLYNAAKQLIKATQESHVNGIATWETNVAYVRFSISGYKGGNIQVEVGTEVTDYIEYNQAKLNPKYIEEIKNKYQLQSILGEEANKIIKETLLDSEKLTLSNYPYYLKKGMNLSFRCKINSFNKIILGKGYETYRGNWIEIDSTNVVHKKYESSTYTVGTYEHGLNIETFINIVMYVDHSGELLLILQSKNGSIFKKVLSYGYESCGAAFVKSEGSELSDVVFNATSSDFKKSVWAIGDSYFGISTNRLMGALRNLGFFELLVNGLAGQASPAAFNDFKRMLNFGAPKYLLWCLGMNDNNTVYQETFEKVKEICKVRGIIFIPATIPTVPTREKEVISSYVREHSDRYIDFYNAVGADSQGNWNEGYLSSDGVHPTSEGANALAMQVLVDFPELMQYGLTKTTSEIGDITGDK